MSVEILKQDLKEGKLRPVYYLCGREPYLKYYYYTMLRKASLGEGDAAADVVEFSGAEADAQELCESITSFPMTCERKTVVVTDPVYSSDPVLRILRDPELLSDSCTLIFYDSSARAETKSEASKAFLAFVEKYGLVVRADELDRRTLAAWVTKKVRARSRSISPQTTETLLNRVGTDMFTLAGELEKLCAYCSGEITPQAIEEISTLTDEARTFDLSDAILAGNAAEAMRILDILADLRTDPGFTAGAVFTAVCNLYKVCLLRDQGCSPDVLAEKCGLKPFLVRKYLTAASRRKTEEVGKLLDACMRADSEMKGGAAAVDPYLILTKLTAVLCAKKSV